MKFISILVFSLFLQAQAQTVTQYVNPFIGTGGHGHTYPGATLPFGFVQLSPDTRPDGYNDWDGCGGYHYSDSIIYGFSHTHLSGTGIADYCDVLLMPTVGTPTTINMVGNNPKTGYASLFSHEKEKASPGYYAVMLEDDAIQVELTSTTRVGMHKYVFPKTSQSNIILDLMHRDALLEGSYIEVISPTKIQGLRRSSSWAKDQWLYFAIEFSQPFTLAGVKDSAGFSKTGGAVFKPLIMSGKQLQAYFSFNTLNTQTITVKCALSSVSCTGAWKNMQAELPHWDFEKVKTEAAYIWNYELSKIKVSSINDEKKLLTDADNKLVIFYTALYHSMLAPNIYEDVDDQYRGRDNTIHVSNNFNNYTVFSLWDTFRALHPLLTLIDPDRTNDFVKTFIAQYEQGGRLPVWELSANETECMIGYHAVSVIADAAVKGITDYDLQKAYAAMKHSANLDHFGLSFYKNKGYIESNEEPESVSKTIEYSYNDWCIAQMGKLVEAPNNEITLYQKRGANYLNLIDNGLARPRFNGGWYAPFDATEVNFNYTEANAWQYSLFAPQTQNYDAIFEQRLNELFTTNTGTSGRQQADITGLIGQYAHGNEPSHNYAYLFNRTSTAWQTQYYVNNIMTEFYKNSPDGLIGNEDCGQMSAWYVLSALGIYPVCPGKPEYDFGAAIFDKVVLELENNKKLTIVSNNRSDKSIYLQSVQLNNQNFSGLTIAHKDIINGGTLTFNFTDNKELAIQSAISSKPNALNYVAPIITGPGNSFVQKANIQISTVQQEGYITYKINNEAEQVVKITGKPLELTIDKTATISARYCAYVDYPLNYVVDCSGVSTAQFTQRDNNFNITYLTKYSSQYTAGGTTALIDGLRGGSDFRTGMWQGWWGENMELTLNCGSKKTFTTVGAGFLQDVRSWIWMPKQLEVYVSNDGKNFTLLTTINNTISTTNYESKEIQNLTATVPSTTAQYIKFKAVNFGIVPDWHPGKGGNTWVFCDEVWVE
ncbi:MAG: GH92 family glycosyl hydrolase [Bacteroidetes bacterium]|nr:GH92 family glycosyl hydrolase [Bacteroidota bacterium]